MHKVLVNRLGGLSLPRKSVVRLTDRPDMTLDVYRGRKTTIQQQQSNTENIIICMFFHQFKISSRRLSPSLSSTPNRHLAVFVVQVDSCPAPLGEARKQIVDMLVVSCLNPTSLFKLTKNQLYVRDRAWFVRLYGEIIPEL